jgi:hypothetical protein
MKKTKIVAAGIVSVVAVLGLTGCAGSFDLFQKAYSSCGTPAGVSVSDNGTTISVDTMGDSEYSGASYSDLVCVIDAVGTPSYINDNIMSVRAIDGRQSDEFNGIVVSYSFHPDNGMDIVFHKK